MAEGLIHDDYGTGVDVALDLGAIGPPFELRAALFQPTRDFPRSVADITPLVLVRVDWLPSLFENAGLFLAARRDRTGGLAELVRSAYVEDDVVRLSGAGPRLAGLRHRLARAGRPALLRADLHRHPGLGRHQRQPGHLRRPAPALDAGGAAGPPRQLGTAAGTAAGGHPAARLGGLDPLPGLAGAVALGHALVPLPLRRPAAAGEGAARAAGRATAPSWA